MRNVDFILSQEVRGTDHPCAEKRAIRQVLGEPLLKPFAQRVVITLELMAIPHASNRADGGSVFTLWLPQHAGRRKTDTSIVDSIREG